MINREGRWNVKTNIFLGWFLCCIFWVASSVCCFGKDIYVPGDYPTITEAVAAAEAGDRIRVAEGEYDENTGEIFPIQIKSNLTITGSGRGTVVRNGESSDIFESGYSGIENVILENMTLQCGAEWFTNPMIDILGNNITIRKLCLKPARSIIKVFDLSCLVSLHGDRNLNVVDNSVTGFTFYSPYFLGIHVFEVSASEGSILISNNRIENNICDNEKMWGIVVYFTGNNCCIRGNLIRHNKMIAQILGVSYSLRFKGIFLWAGGSGTTDEIVIENNVITDNVLQLIGGSEVSLGEILFAGMDILTFEITNDLKIKHNLIANNSCIYIGDPSTEEEIIASSSGISLHAALEDSIYRAYSIVNNTVAYNNINITAQTWFNPAFSLRKREMPFEKGYVCNNLFSSNLGGVVLNGNLEDFDLNFSYNDVYGNTLGDYIGIPSQTGINGNIGENPMLEDVYGSDFHLKMFSPCIDAGDPEMDVGDEPMPNGGRINIGIYGGTSEATSSSPHPPEEGVQAEIKCPISVQIKGGMKDG